MALLADGLAAERPAGKRAAFSNRKAISRDAHGAMMVEAAAGTTPEVVSPVLLEFLEGAPEALAQRLWSDQLLKQRSGWEVGQPLRDGSGVAAGLLDEQPRFATR